LETLISKSPTFLRQPPFPDPSGSQKSESSKPMRAIFFPLALLLFPALHAAPNRPVECRFLKLGSGGGLNAVIVSPEKGQDITCPLSSSGVSTRITCPARENVIHFLSDGDKDELVVATIPPTMKSALLVFFRTKATPAKVEEVEEVKESEQDVGTTTAVAEETVWQVLVIDDAARNDPTDGGLVGNCYPAAMRSRIGAGPETLATMETRRFATPTEKDDFNMAPVILELNDGESWKKASESSLRFLPGSRYLLFLYPDESSGRPRVAMIQE
jgi:hypothetical protein